LKYNCEFYPLGKKKIKVPTHFTLQKRGDVSEKAVTYLPFRNDYSNPLPPPVFSLYLSKGGGEVADIKWNGPVFDLIGLVLGSLY